MSEFQLDTSGVVVSSAHPFHPYSWDGAEPGTFPLSPFVQGYGREMADALFAELVAFGWSLEDAARAVAFHNWHSETLARIIEDCAENSSSASTARSGKMFWHNRQGGHVPNFPPLSLSLDDNGKVVFG